MMAHYIVSFTVYVMAMAGLITLALFVYKKVTNVSTSNKKTKALSIEETMSINPRKTLMIVRAGDERFLIASDVDKTTLISKLGQNESAYTGVQTVQTADLPKSTVVDLQKVKNTIDKENMDVLFPKKLKKDTKTVKPAGKPELKKQPVADAKKTVHLEVISDKNPKGAELRKNRSYMQTRRRNVTIEVGEIKNHGFSTIKELVHKVNEI